MIIEFVFGLVHLLLVSLVMLAEWFLILAAIVVELLLSLIAWLVELVLFLFHSKRRIERPKLVKKVRAWREKRSGKAGATQVAEEDGAAEENAGPVVDEDAAARDDGGAGVEAKSSGEPKRRRSPREIGIGLVILAIQLLITYGVVKMLGLFE